MSSLQLEMRLKREFTISDVLEQYPDAAPLLAENGIHCVGCHASPFETLEEGFRSHGMTDKQIDEALLGINKKLEIILKKKPSSHMKNIPGDLTLEITDIASAKVLAVMKQEKKDPKRTVLRIAVLPGGCAGFRYDFSFAPLKKKKDDVAFEKNGITVLIDKHSLQFMNGSAVDYSEGLHGAGFIVKNPQAKKGCGCGKSFNS